MKVVVWDDPDPRVVFDNPNLHFGYLLEAGDPGYVELQPGQPGYIPPPPAPKAKRRRRRAHSSTTTEPANNTTAMSIPYYTAPTSDGSKVTTRIAYRGTKTKAEWLAEIQERLTAASLPLTIENVLHVNYEVVIDWNIDAWKMEPFDGLMGHFFSGGGAQADLQGPWTYGSMRIASGCNLGEEGEQRARDLFSAENRGHKGRVVPIFAKVTDTFTGLPFHYTAGKSILIELGNRSVDFDRTKGCKVRWKLANGTFVDADDYGFVEGTRISAHVPGTGVTGVIELVLVILINDRLVTATYEHALTP